MYALFDPCVSCARHVRASDSPYPFCGEARTPDPTVHAAPAPLRLSRSALVMGTTLALAACDRATPQRLPEAPIAQPYGAPVPPPTDVAVDPRVANFPPVPVYGAPSPPPPVDLRDLARPVDPDAAVNPDPDRHR